MELGDGQVDGKCRTVFALAEQFPATLMTLIADALAGDGDDDEDDAEDEALALVDLSAAVFDDDE